MGGDVRPQREEFEAALLTDTQFLILEVRQINQCSLERLLGKIGLGHVERCGLRNEAAQRAIGLLDTPAQLAPQPHEQVNAQKRNRIGLFNAIGVLQRRQVKVASGIEIGQHQNFIEGNRLQLGL